MVTEERPAILGPKSDPPPIFDGTTRLYICYKCPYSHRVWMARNYKGLQDQIQLMAIDSWHRPKWYKEKVYDYDKVPSLEHKQQIHADSVELLKYIEKHFPGPSIMPKTPSKKKACEDMIYHCDQFVKYIIQTFRGDPKDEARNYLDQFDRYTLKRHDDGPFILGEFSMVDIIYAPFVDRFHTFFKAQFDFDITKGRPNLERWLEEINKMDCYKETKPDPEVVHKTWRTRYITLRFEEHLQ